MEFSEYLVAKKIDETLFSKGAPDMYAEFRYLFEQMHPKSFTLQKLYLINGIRRDFPLPVTKKSDSAKKVTGRPKIPVRKPAQTTTEDKENRIRTEKPKVPRKSGPKMKPKIGGRASSDKDPATPGKKATKPVMKPKIPPKQKGEQTQAKPVIKAKTDRDDQGGPGAKKPKMKPRIPKQSNNEDAGSKKPKPKPVIKPKGIGNAESGNEKITKKEDSVEKKKPIKPVIKPRKKDK